MVLRTTSPSRTNKCPKLETLALLQQQYQARSSTMPDIDKLLRIVAQENEKLADKPLFWSDFRPVDEEFEMANEMRSMKTPKTVKGISSMAEVSLPENTEDLRKTEQEERTFSLFLRESASDFHPIESIDPQLFSPQLQDQETARERESLPSPPTSSTEVREVSTLQINARIRNIISIPAEISSVSTTRDESGLKSRQQRGRSMLRTSDIIEARLSALLQAQKIKNNTAEELPNEQRARIISPLRCNPVNISTISDQRNRTLSPLPRNPSNDTISIRKRKSRTLSPPSLPNLNPVPPPTTAARDESHLLRNPPLPLPSQPRTPSNIISSSAASKQNSSLTFSPKLARFQNLAEKTTKGGKQASTEVTQRAVAGIYIPGSLNEQDVRNSSKSRERKRGGNGVGEELE
jgi:hypothetical protein